mgnify:CR=1 FL=1
MANDFAAPGKGENPPAPEQPQTIASPPLTCNTVPVT